MTATEQRNAEKYIAERKQGKKSGSPVAVAIDLRRAGKITGDALRKIDVPPPSKMTAKSEEESDDLVQLQLPIDALRRALRENPEPLRTAFAIAGLQVVIDVALKIIDELKKNERRV